MQRRNFKDAMNEMCDHTVAKIQEHSETLIRLDKEQKGELLKFGSVEMDTDFPRTDTHKDTMEKVLGTLNVGKDPFATQKELIKKFADESSKK